MSTDEKDNIEDQQEAPQPAEEDQQAEATGNTDQLTLQEIIAQQRAKLKVKLKDPDGNDASQSPELAASQEPSAEAEKEVPPAEADARGAEDQGSVDTDQATVQEIIARQRASLKGESPQTADTPAARASSVEAETPFAEDAVSETDGGTDQQQTLEEIIARQRVKLKAQEPTEQKAAAAQQPQARQEQAASPVADEATPPQEAEQTPAASRAVAQKPQSDAPAGFAGKPQPSQANVRGDDGRGDVKRFAAATGAAARGATLAVADRKWRFMPLLLAANTVLVVIVAIVVLRLGPSPASSDASTQKAFVLHVPPVGADTGEVTEGLNTPVYMDDQLRRQGEHAFAEGKYGAALQQYEKLLREAQAAPSAARLRDFLSLRIAECMVKLGQTNQARQALREPAMSTCPVVRGLANRDLAVLDGRDGQYLAARRRAYVAMGVLGFTEDGYGVETDCDYLVARALTEEMLAFAGQKLDVSWDDVRSSDPFTGKTSLLLRRTLADGVGTLAQATLNPSISQISGAEIGKQWRGIFSEILLEDLLGRISSESGLGVQWVSIEPRIQRRVVPVLGGNGVSLQKLTEIACGSAGLLARFTGQEVQVHNPRWSQSMEVRRDLLVREAVSVWRRFFLRAPDDPRVATGHYAMGRLYESAGQPIEAMRVYRLVSSRYWRSKVGAPSLLRSATIRIEQLKDYTGAERDLLELLDRYPETELFGQVYLSMGRAQEQAGMLDKAARTFERLYYFDELATEHRRRACLEAGRCYYRRKSYSTAAKWVTRYLGLSDGSSAQLSEAYMLLGDSAAGAGNYDEAALAYQKVLSGHPTNAQRVEAMLALVPVQLARQKFVHVVGALQQLEKDKLTTPQFGRFLLLASKAYRQMALPRKAITLLSNHVASFENAAVRTSLRMELARCHRQLGRYGEARTALTEVLGASGSTEIGYEAQCELAEVSLEMGEVNEAIATARELIGSACPRNIRLKASAVLGAAYVHAGQYEKAAEALAGVTDKQATARQGQ